MDICVSKNSQCIVCSKGGTGLLLLYDVMLIDFRSECRKMAKRKMITVLRNPFIELNLSKVSSICICTMFNILNICLVAFANIT